MDMVMLLAMQESLDSSSNIGARGPKVQDYPWPQTVCGEFTLYESLLQKEKRF